MKKSVLLKVFFGCIQFVIGLGGAALLAIAPIAVLNSDLNGRLTETVSVVTPSSASEGDTEAPTVRLVLHRVLPDENAVEASTVLIVGQDLDLRRAIENGAVAFTAEVADGQGIGKIMHRLTLDRTSVTPGLGEVAIQSERFVLPSLPSQYGYPFDDLRIRPFLNVSLPSGFSVPFHTEIQKAISGRSVATATDSGGLPEVILTRPLTEKLVVSIGVSVFILISVLVAVTLFSTSLSKVEELVAVAGFLLAMVGIRDLLGLSRATGTSALEVLVVSVPLLSLAVALGVSTMRGYRGTKNGRATRPRVVTAEECPPAKTPNQTTAPGGWRRR